jgi:hypothetical protein
VPLIIIPSRCLLTTKHYAELTMKNNSLTYSHCQNNLALLAASFNVDLASPDPPGISPERPVVNPPCLHLLLH